MSLIDAIAPKTAHSQLVAAFNQVKTALSAKPVGTAVQAWYGNVHFLKDGELMVSEVINQAEPFEQLSQPVRLEDMALTEDDQLGYAFHLVNALEAGIMVQLNEQLNRIVPTEAEQKELEREAELRDPFGAVIKKMEACGWRQSETGAVYSPEAFTPGHADWLSAIKACIERGSSFN